MLNFFRRILNSMLYKFIDKKKEYDVGRVRALVKFCNGKTTEITILGETIVSIEAMNRSGMYPLEFRINKALDIFHDFLDRIDCGAVDFIVGDNRVYYRLDINKVDEIRIMETSSHIVTETVYEKVKK